MPQLKLITANEIEDDAKRVAFMLGLSEFVKHVNNFRNIINKLKHILSM